MPSKDHQAAVTPDAAREQVATSGFPKSGRTTLVDGIGLEPETFAVRITDAGGPGERLPLAGPEGVLAIVDELARSEPWLAPRDPAEASPRYQLSQGGSLTFEPGAQIEHSTAIHDTAIAALRDVDQTRAALCGAFRRRGAALVKLGLDLWNDADAVPQQLDAPRYHAMAAYFDRRGPHGRTMMRRTASCQINLDLGPPDVALERWKLTNLISPLITATFAASPADGDGADGAEGAVVCARARAWQQLDPTRTGFPRRFLLGDDDPVGVLTDAALAADVLLFKTPDGRWLPGEPGFTFERWMREGHPLCGWPTLEDFEYHRTTCFFEVRCRGFFELRACDALPEPWHAVAPVLLTGLLYDPRARAAGLALLEPHRADLHELWLRSARAGLRDPLLGALAPEVWAAALEGARRLPGDYCSAHYLQSAADFLERFTARGRMPTDELREALAEGPKAALAWATGDAPCPDRESVGV